MIESDLVTFDITSGKLVVSEPLNFKLKRLESVYPAKGILDLEVKDGVWTSTLKHRGKGADFITFALISYLDVSDSEKDWVYLGVVPTKSGNLALFDYAYLEESFCLPTYKDFSNIFHIHNFTKNGKAVPVFSLLDADYLGVTVYTENRDSDFDVYVQYTDDKITAVKILFSEEQ